MAILLRCFLYQENFSTLISDPSGTPFNISGFPTTLPNMFTRFAAFISFSVLTGVIPKKIQNPWPTGQYLSSPSLIESLASFSFGSFKGISKYISSPHLLTFPRKGRASHISDAVLVSCRFAKTSISPTIILILFTFVHS